MLPSSLASRRALQEKLRHQCAHTGACHTAAAFGVDHPGEQRCEHFGKDGRTDVDPEQTFMLPTQEKRIEGVG